MPFPASRVGQDLRATERTISVRDILAYAAGLGAVEPAFLDDHQAGGVRALPFQCVSLEWPALLSLRAALGDSLAPDEARRGVHAVQDSTFHRPIVPGDRLITEGRLIGAQRIRTGVRTVCKLVTRDAIDGAAVATSWSSSIYRGVDLAGEDQTLEAPPGLPPEASDPLPVDAETVSLAIPRQMPHVYSECANIWNPIHTERREALAAGLPDIILHGTATWALAGLTVLRHYTGGDVGRLKRMSGRFSGMIVPGGHIGLRHHAIGAGVVRFEVLDDAGKPAISQGVAYLD
jgi:acyl dehydratase